MPRSPALAPRATTLAALALGACIDRPAPAPVRAPSPTTSAPVAAPTLPPAAPAPLAPAAPPAAPGAPDSPALAVVRAWIARTEAAAPFRGGSLDAAPEFDTPQVRCARATVPNAPDPLRATRLLCVASSTNEVLAGEPGLQRHLQMHQFEPALAVPAARVLLELRDAMLGLAGRVYAEVNARAEGDALVVDVRGAAKPSPSAEPVPSRWRFTLRRDGTTREESLPAAP